MLAARKVRTCYLLTGSVHSCLCNTSRTAVLIDNLLSWLQTTCIYLDNSHCNFNGPYKHHTLPTRGLVAKVVPADSGLQVIKRVKDFKGSGIHTTTLYPVFWDGGRSWSSELLAKLARSFMASHPMDLWTNPRSNMTAMDPDKQHHRLGTLSYTAGNSESMRVGIRPIGVGECR